MIYLVIISIIVSGVVYKWTRKRKLRQVKAYTVQLHGIIYISRGSQLLSGTRLWEKNGYSYLADYSNRAMHDKGFVWMNNNLTLGVF